MRCPCVLWPVSNVPLGTHKLGNSQPHPLSTDTPNKLVQHHVTRLASHCLTAPRPRHRFVLWVLLAELRRRYEHDCPALSQN
jgi:hypothetical protein